MSQVTYFAYSRKENAYYVKHNPMEFSASQEGAEIFTNTNKKKVQEFLENIDPQNQYDWYIEKVEFNHLMGEGSLHGLIV